MTTDPGSLLHVLRHELNAVNQQFFHILALREWGEQDAVAQITRVDNIDFPNAMRIIDYFVSTGKPMDLSTAEFLPGTDYRSILVSELKLEQRLLAALDNAEPANADEAKFLQAAKNPREQYLKWLEDSVSKESANDSKTFKIRLETANIVGHLISLVEQSMVHAFVHWHDGDRDAADDAWATSGAAMMHLTELVRLFARLPSVPFPSNFPALDIQRDAVNALESDKQLASLCANEASQASVRCSDIPIAELCGNIANYCSEFSNWETATPHPAESSNPAAFQSFEITLDKFVH